MSAGFQYDVFLSHNQADKPRVRRLAEMLKAAGLRVWFDEWIVKPGTTSTWPWSAGSRRRARRCSAYRRRRWDHSG